MENKHENQNERAIFPKGMQKKFLKQVKENLELKWTEMEKLIKEKTEYSPGSLRNWRAETCSIPLNVVKFLSTISKVKIPEDIEVRTVNWGRIKGGSSFLGVYGIEAFKKIGLRGREKTIKLYGLNAWKNLASKGGKVAYEMKAGIFSDKYNEDKKYWRKIPFEKKIGIFDKKYDQKRNLWRFKSFVSGPKRNVETSTGTKVRSKEEKEILENLVKWGFNPVYEPCQIPITESTWIVPDFGFKDSSNIFIEHLGRHDDTYWNYKLNRWLKGIKHTPAKFVIVAHNVDKTAKDFGNLDNVIKIVKYGDWNCLKTILSQLCLKRNQSRCP